MYKPLIGLALAASLGGCVARDGDGLRVYWQKGERDMLTIRSSRVPGGKIETWYLEAFCRRGSTDRDWLETVIPFESQPVAADPDGRWVKLRHIVEGKVLIDHEIRAGHDEVDLRMTITNRSDEFVDLDWAQPCIRVGDFTGRGQDDYFEKCFIFTDKGLTWMHQTHRETQARYTPGQVYVSEGIDLNDVNPRPLSKTRPINSLVGCVSADEKMILAMAWDQAQELFQGIIVCIHSDVRVGGLKPRETKTRHGKIYVVPNNVPALMDRYQRDFGK